MTMYTNSFELLIRILGRIGVVIANEDELRNRLKEVSNWRYAFKTLVNNGKRIGITFRTNNSISDAKLEHALAKFHFDPSFVSQFITQVRTVD